MIGHAWRTLIPNLFIKISFSTCPVNSWGGLSSFFEIFSSFILLLKSCQFDYPFQYPGTTLFEA